MLQNQKPKTRSIYRSVQYRVNRIDQTRTADPSTCNFRIKRNSMIEATMANTIETVGKNASNCLNMSAPDINELRKTDCIRSFNSMMNASSQIKYRDQSRKREPSFFNDSRILLPNFAQTQKQVQNSQHTLLTPFNSPYIHTQSILTNSQNQLKNQKNICSQIRFGLTHINKIICKELEQLQKYGNSCFDGIRASIRKNQIVQQEKKFKIRREIQMLEGQHVENRRLFENLDASSSGLQVTLFNSTPFNVRDRLEDETGQIYI